MRRSRIVIVPEARSAWHARLANLCQTNSVLIVASRLNEIALRKELQGASLDLERIFIVDVTPGDASRSADPAHGMRLGNPAMLELIHTRVKLVIRKFAERRTCVVFDDVDTMLQYNEEMAIWEALNYAFHDDVFKDVELEIVASPTIANTALAARLRDYDTSIYNLMADGTPTLLT